jgi:SAM-dependent methyltransferase
MIWPVNFIQPLTHWVNINNGTNPWGNQLVRDEIKRDLVKTYNRHAAQRDDREIVDWRVAELDQFAGLLQQQRKKTVLEIGAGTGLESQFFLAQGFNITSTDQSPEMVKFCRDKGLSAVLMDFYHLSFAQAQFDAVWGFNCLLHVPKKDLPVVLKGIEAVLKPEGLLYAAVWGGTDFEGVWEDDPYIPKRFFSFYPDEQIQVVMSEVFEVIEFKPVAIEGRELHIQSMILRK